jgi:hypothetical protein
MSEDLSGLYRKAIDQEHDSMIAISEPGLEVVAGAEYIKEEFTIERSAALVSRLKKFGSFIKRSYKEFMIGLEKPEDLPIEDEDPNNQTF